MRFITKYIKDETLQMLAQKLAKQRVRCMGRAGCLYDNGFGHRCAVGHLLTTEQIEELRGRNSLGQPIAGMPHLVSTLLPHATPAAADNTDGLIYALMSLQKWHDNDTLEVVNGEPTYLTLLDRHRQDSETKLAAALLHALRGLELSY